MSDLLITLADGSKVTLDEFLTWSHARQQNKLMSKEQRAKINDKIRAANARKVVTPEGEFPSLSIAANALGMNRDVLSKMLYNTAIPEYRYLERKEEDALREFDGNLIKEKPKRITYTPIGEFTSQRNAVKALNIKAHVFAKLLITNPTEYYVRMSDGSPAPSMSRPLTNPRPKKPKVKLEKKIRIYREVITPKGTFPSINEAAKAHNISKERILRKIYNLDIKDFKFKEATEKDKKHYYTNDDNNVARKVITPKGTFKTVKEAAKFLKISEDTLKRRIYDISNEAYKFNKELSRDKDRYYDGSKKKKDIAKAKTRAVITPKGRFETLSDASNVYKIGVDVLRRYVFNTAYPEFRYETEQPRDKEKYFHKIIPNSFHKPTVFIKTPLGLFKSIGEAAIAHNMPRHQMERKSLSDKYPEFQRVEQAHGEYDHVKTKKKKTTVTPLGTFNSKIEAIRAHKISRDEFTKLMKSFPKKYYFLESKT